MLSCRAAQAIGEFERFLRAELLYGLTQISDSSCVLPALHLRALCAPLLPPPAIAAAPRGKHAMLSGLSFPSDDPVLASTDHLVSMST